MMTNYDTLLASLQEPWTGDLAVDKLDWDGLTQLAIVHQVAPLLYHRLRTTQLLSQAPAPIQKKLQKAYYYNAVRNLQLYKQLALILTALHERAIAVVILKGVHLAAAVYDNTALRTMADIDFMVHPSDLPAVVEVLAQLGYQPSNPIGDITLHLDHIHHLPRFTKADEPTVEVHWTITRAHQSYTIAMDELWTRAQPLMVNGAPALVLAPEDTLLYLCLHATYHHHLQQGIRFLCDVTMFARKYHTQLDWTIVIQRAQSWHWQRGVHLAFYVAHQYMNAAIPPDVIRQLQPPGFTQAIAELAYTYLYHDNEHDNSYASALPKNFNRLLRNLPLSKKAETILNRIFLPRVILAARYNVAPTSPHLWLYYLRHIFEQLQRLRKLPWRQLRNEPALAAFAQRQNTLLTWLEQ